MESNELQFKRFIKLQVCWKVKNSKSYQSMTLPGCINEKQ